MFKVGDRVKLLCRFNHGANGVVTEVRYDYFPEWNDGKLWMPVRVRRDHESGDGLWFHESELKLVKEEKKMFEIGKKYRHQSGALYVCLGVHKFRSNDIAGVMQFVPENFESQDNGDIPHVHQWSDAWKEYVEPKVVTQELYIRTNGEKIWVNSTSYPPLHGANDIGKIRITYVEPQSGGRREGSGIAVEVLEGGDSGTV